MWLFNILFAPAHLLVALMDWGNGKTFKENYDIITAKDIEVEGPNYEDKNKRGKNE